MKKLLLLFCSLVLVFVLTTPTLAGDNGQTKGKQKCTTIQEAVLKTEDGDFIHPGYDQYGYNYQARMFNGTDCGSVRNQGPCSDEIHLIMKWNDAWLSNMDCDADGKLDRHFGFPSYKGSGAWLTNHWSGAYMWEGKECKWMNFVKIVAVPADATKVGGFWYAADGTVIGPDIWGEFATVQSIYTDPCAGAKGLEYLSPVGPGFGKFKPKD